MPLLRVYCQEHPQQVAATFQQGVRNFNAWQYVAAAGMGGYYWSDNLAPPYPPLLATGSASPCVIVVVHCANGKGALGHLGGTHAGNDNILRAAIDMHARLSHPRPLDTIVLAGGGGIAQGSGDGHLQGGYRADVMRQIRNHFGNAVDVRWPVLDGTDVNDAYTEAAYLPTMHTLALSDTHTVQGSPNPALPSAGYGY